MLFGCYRRGDANDPERYVAAIAAVLSLYDADLIREVTDPRTGIQTTEKHMTFMPQAGELKVYCEGVAASKERLKRLAALPRPHRVEAASPALPGALAQVFVPHTHTRYARLVEWSRTADPRFWKVAKSSDGRQGIWVSWSVWVEPHTSSNARSAPSEIQPLSQAAWKVMKEIDEVRAWSGDDYEPMS